MDILFMTRAGALLVATKNHAIIFVKRSEICTGHAYGIIFPAVFQKAII